MNSFDDFADHLAAAHSGYQLATQLILATQRIEKLEHAINRAAWIRDADLERRVSWLSRAVIDSWPGGDDVPLETIADAVGERAARVSQCLERLARQGVATKSRRGTWSLARKRRNGRRRGGVACRT
jgi:hypothetical protein